jgi:hypothetical protein
MAKKKKAGKAKKKATKAKKKRATPARARKATGTNEVVLTKIIIPPNGNTAKPVGLVSFHRGPLVWLIHNRSKNDHTITIDPSTFVDQNNMPLNPLTTNNPLTTETIPPGKWDVLIAKIDKAAILTSYKYELAQTDMVTRAVKVIDPDLDVIDPQP